MPNPSSPRPYHHGSLRTALLEAAERALRERGADEISLRDLARELGVSHGAPRRHFADRRELLDALAESGFTRLGAELQETLVRAGDDFPGRVRDAVSAFARFATDDPRLLELMHSGKHRPGATTIAVAADAAFAPVVELIRDGQNRGALQQGDPEQIGTILYATVHGLTTMVNGGMVEATALDALVEAAVTQFLRGSRPPTARPCGRA